jgi:outer membrane lipoprotein LolB
MKRPGATAAVFVALLTGGCAHLADEGDGLTLAERQARLASLPAWEMRGRLAVSSPDGGFQGSFLWHAVNENITLTVRGPFGASVLHVTGTSDALTVTARGDTWELGDPEIELSALLGWWVPVTSLGAWLTGRPDPEWQARSEPGPARTIGALEQRLWRVEYPAWQLREGLLLPRRIDMTHDDLSLRVTVDSFSAQTVAGSAGLN